VEVIRDHRLRDNGTTGQLTTDNQTNNMRDYTKIEAWKLADDLTVAICERTRSFPKDEIYGLTSQVRRASYSVPANIVEGSSRDSKKDYLHFLYIARGSLSETQYFIHLAGRLGYISVENAAALDKQTKRTFACLHGLIRAVEKESGKFSKAAAAITSLLVIGVARWSTSFLTNAQ
jgi:four helix bundle protein